MPASPAKNIHWSKFTCDMRDGAIRHFLPHETNGYVPHVLKHHVLGAYTVIGILLKALIVLAPTVLPAAAVYSNTITPGNIVKLTNVARSGAGLSELQSNDRLANAAAGKADDIIAKQYFAHVSPEGKTPWDWIRGAGYDYRHAGENLAIHFFTAEGVHDGWMASPTHKQNIVDARYADIGVGVQQGTYEGFDTVVVVQMFGTPKASALASAGTASEPAPTEPAPEPAPAPAAEPAPAPAPEPTPAPTPSGTDTSTGTVAGTEREEPAPAAPQNAEVKVTPSAKGFAVKVEAPAAEKVQAYLGTETAELEKAEDGTWQGEVPVTAPATESQYLLVGSTDAEGNVQYEPVAAIVPSPNAVDLYAGNGSRTQSTLFGQRVTGLEDGVRRFYAFAAMFLFAALAVKVALNLERQRKHTVIAHSLFVIGLFMVLSVS